MITSYSGWIVKQNRNGRDSAPHCLQSLIIKIIFLLLRINHCYFNLLFNLKKKLSSKTFLLLFLNQQFTVFELSLSECTVIKKKNFFFSRQFRISVFRCSGVPVFSIPNIVFHFRFSEKSSCFARGDLSENWQVLAQLCTQDLKKAAVAKVVLKYGWRLRKQNNSVSSSPYCVNARSG